MIWILWKKLVHAKSGHLIAREIILKHHKKWNFVALIRSVFKMVTWPRAETAPSWLFGQWSVYGYSHPLTIRSDNLIKFVWEQHWYSQMSNFMARNPEVLFIPGCAISNAPATTFLDSHYGDSSLQTPSYSFMAKESRLYASERGATLLWDPQKDSLLELFCSSLVDLAALLMGLEFFIKLKSTESGTECLIIAPQHMSSRGVGEGDTVLDQ